MHINGKTDNIPYAIYSVASYGTNKPFSRVYYDKYAREIASYSYDIENRVIITSKLYNNDGSLIEEKLPHRKNQSSSTISYTYDKYKRLIKKTIPSPTGSGNVDIDISYDKLSTTTTQNGRSTTTITDARGKTIRVIDPNNNEITYSYYADGKLKSTTTPNGKSNTLTYDLLGYKLTSSESRYGSVDI